jgi:hypothetical protein
MPQHTTGTPFDSRALSSAEITERLKSLLETQHMYQSLLVDFEPIIKGIDDIGLSMRRINELEVATRVVKVPWVPVLNRLNPAGNPPREKVEGPLEFVCPDAKLYCDRCHRVEAFNCRSAQEVFCQSMVAMPGKPEQTVQVFVLSLVCQSCKGVPETFLVRREGPFLIMVGRAPMERHDVPPFIPACVRKFCEEALVARHSGHFLAANALLRCVIELWVKKVTGLETDGDAQPLVEEYANGLPPTFDAHFPTLMETYASLKSDVTKGVGSAEVFDSAIEQIATHFDARRLLKMPTN